MLNQEQEKAHHYPMDNSQTPVHGHDQKADLIWNDFKDRFGIWTFESMLFDLPSLLIQDSDLSSLEDPMSEEEIDSVVIALLLDKSPGTWLF